MEVKYFIHSVSCLSQSTCYALFWIKITDIYSVHVEVIEEERKQREK